MIDVTSRIETATKEHDARLKGTTHPMTVHEILGPAGQAGAPALGSEG